MTVSLYLLIRLIDNNCAVSLKTTTGDRLERSGTESHVVTRPADIHFRDCLLVNVDQFAAEPWDPSPARYESTLNCKKLNTACYDNKVLFSAFSEVCTCVRSALRAFQWWSFTIRTCGHDHHLQLQLLYWVVDRQRVIIEFVSHMDVGRHESVNYILFNCI